MAGVECRACVCPAGHDYPWLVAWQAIWQHQAEASWAGLDLEEVACYGLPAVSKIGTAWRCVANWWCWCKQ